MLQIKFLDLSKQQKTIEKSLRINLEKVLADSKFIMGQNNVSKELNQKKLLIKIKN